MSPCGFIYIQLISVVILSTPSTSSQHNDVLFYSSSVSYLTFPSHYFTCKWRCFCPCINQYLAYPPLPLSFSRRCYLCLYLHIFLIKHHTRNIYCSFYGHIFCNISFYVTGIILSLFFTTKWHLSCFIYKPIF